MKIPTQLKRSASVYNKVHLIQQIINFQNEIQSICSRNIWREDIEIFHFSCCHLSLIFIAFEEAENEAKHLPMLNIIFEIEIYIYRIYRRYTSFLVKLMSWKFVFVHFWIRWDVHARVKISNLIRKQFIQTHKIFCSIS